MFWVLASIVVVLVLFVALGYSKSGWKLRGRQLIALLGFVVVLGGMVATVPTGHTGILTTFGKVEDKTLEAGMHIKSPFQEIVCMDNRTQVAHLELSAFSSDIQEVLVSYSMNYQIEKSNAQKIYKEIGVDYYNTVMAPRIQEVVKSVIAKYTAEDLIESREALSVQITNSLIEQLGAYNIVVVSTAVEDIDFSDAFTASVEDKVVAEQALLKAQTEQAQKTMEEEKAAEREKIKAAADAEVKEIQAAADAEVAKIKAAAEAEAKKLAADAEKYAGEKEAEANKALAESLTEALIKYYEALGWDGKLPETVVSGTDTILPVLGGGTVNTPAEGSN
ncbi:MAG: prohibitin family protein [Clostridia bacterium]|nr:prohibitin family protein [Clostridia bacterium]